MQQVAESRLVTIEGQRALIVERRPPLQPTLDGLLGALYHLRAAQDIRPSGARAACEVERDHPFELLREGRHVGLDAVVRDLRVLMCPFCGAVQVRDISFDVAVAGERLPRQGAPRRRDLVLGWYTGRRRANREYR